MTVTPAADEPQTYEDRPVRWFLLAAVIWAVLTAAGAVLLSLLLVMPKLFYELGDSAQYFSYGRLYPVQMQWLTYGFLGNGFFAFVYFVIQRLEKVRLSLAPVAMLHWFTWQGLIVAAAVISVTSGTEGRWLSWMLWPFDFALIAIWLLLFVSVVVRTLTRRPRPARLAAPLWFVLAAIVVIPLLHFFNNLPSGDQLIYSGVQDAMLQWWFARGLVSFWITVPAVAMLYYLVPQLSGGRLFSHRLTVIHFWSIVLLAGWGGNFQWHFTAIPEWANSLAMFAGLLLWLGCLAGAYNLWRSLPRSESRVDRGTANRLVTTAVGCYAVYSLDSGYMSLRSTAVATQFTDWGTANQMLGILGVSGLAMIAFSLVCIPRRTAAVERRARGRLIRWYAIVGAALHIGALYIAGQTQSHSWNKMNDLGRLEYPEFENALLWVQPFWIIAALGAAVWLIAMLAWLVVVVRVLGQTRQTRMIIEVEQAEQVEDADPIVVPSRLVDAPVLGAAVGLEQWSQLAWHAKIERRPVTMAIWIGVFTMAGILLIWLPSFLYHGLNREEAIAMQSPHPAQASYTDLEWMGREIYLREGCVSCHTQASRPLVPEVLRYGDFSRPSDYVFDRPVQIGFRRVGPDLAKEGDRRTSLWHWNHLEDPQSQVPQSVMPTFDYLLSQSLDAGDNPSIRRQAESIAADIVGQGGPAIYGSDLLMNSRGIALIAYLQKLGLFDKPAATQ